MAPLATGLSLRGHNSRTPLYKVTSPPRFNYNVTTTQPMHEAHIISLNPELIDPALSMVVPNNDMRATDKQYVREHGPSYGAQYFSPDPALVDSAMDMGMATGVPYAADTQSVTNNQPRRAPQILSLNPEQVNFALDIQNDDILVENQELASTEQSMSPMQVLPQDSGYINVMTDDMPNNNQREERMGLDYTFTVNELVPVNVSSSSPGPSEADTEGEFEDDVGEDGHNIGAVAETGDEDIEDAINHALDDNKEADDNAAADESTAAVSKQKAYIRISQARWNAGKAKTKEQNDKAKAKNKGKGRVKQVDDSFTIELPTTTRAGRREKKQKRFFDEIYAEEAELARKRTKIDDDNYLDLENPIQAARVQGTKRKLNHRPKQDTYPEARILSLKDNVPEPSNSSAIQSPLTHSFSASISGETKELYSKLSEQCHTELADIQAEDGYDTLWDAQRLTHLYIYSLSKDNSDFCDLIADVWIRAFQERHRDKEECQRMWRHNKYHFERNNYHDYPANGLPPIPGWQKDNPLPLLGGNVTDFDPVLLNQLYYHTPANNGARMLWADAMALCGSHAEKLFVSSKKNGIEWHEDLQLNVLCTSLRLCRRRLTLRIEEVREEAWCERYHVHHMRGQPCYRSEAKKRERDMAADTVPTNEDVQGAEDNQMQLEDVLLALEDDEFENETLPQKQVQFALPPEDRR
ncbi:hypothetical protein N0V90_011682 [Kalmusia sp. IMI 367209]|nr:hypothetical protein N0V90_011682 [Kalmusia sp. IMI 367209]